MAFWFYYGAFRIEACLALCSRVVGPLSVLITTLEDERVFFAHVDFVLLIFLLVFVVGSGL